MDFGFRATEKIRVPVFISCDSPWGQMSQVVRSYSVSFLWGFLHCQVLPCFSSHDPRALDSALPPPLFFDLPMASVSCPSSFSPSCSLLCPWFPLPVPSHDSAFICCVPDALGFACMADTCVCLVHLWLLLVYHGAINALHIPTSPCVMKKRHFLLFICQVF